MSPPPYKRSGLSPLLQVLLALAVLFVGSVGSIVVLAITGVIELPFLRKPAKPKPRPEGIPIPLAVQPVPAFTLVTREHVMDPRTMELVVAPFPAEVVARSGLLTFDKIVGRVLKADKAAGYGFTEKDFFPRGTRPGVVAGVPSGKLAFALDAEKVGGPHELRGGDRVDLLGTISIDLSQVLGKALGQGHHGGLSLSLHEAQNPTLVPKWAGAKVLVRDAVVVRPVTTVQLPVANAVTGPDGKFKTRPVREITLAIDPKEVAPLSAALAAGASICCVAHSGLPDEPPADIPSSPPPPPTFRVIETIVGKKHDVVILPASPAPDTRAAAPADKEKPGDSYRPPPGVVQGR